MRRLRHERFWPPPPTLLPFLPEAPRGRPPYSQIRTLVCANFDVKCIQARTTPYTSPTACGATHCRDLHLLYGGPFRWFKFFSGPAEPWPFLRSGSVECQLCLKVYSREGTFVKPAPGARLLAYRVAFWRQAGSENVSQPSKVISMYLPFRFSAARVDTICTIWELSVLGWWSEFWWTLEWVCWSWWRHWGGRCFRIWDTKVVRHMQKRCHSRISMRVKKRVKEKERKKERESERDKKRERKRVRDRKMIVSTFENLEYE